MTEEDRKIIREWAPGLKKKHEEIFKLLSQTNIIMDISNLYEEQGVINAYFAIQWPQYQKYMEEDWWSEEAVVQNEGDFALIPVDKVEFNL